MFLDERILYSDLKINSKSVPLLEFSKELTQEAILEFSAQLIYFESLKIAIENLLRSKDLLSYAENVQNLKIAFDQYSRHIFFEKRKIQK